MEICNREPRLYESCHEKIHREENSRQGKVSTLRELIDALHDAFKTDHVDIDHVQDLMASYKSNPLEWKKYAKFDRYRYTRNLVDEGNGRFNLMVLCWGEGHGSAIHDHANAHCVMKVLQGELCETRYAWPSVSEESDDTKELAELDRSTLRLNEICYINDSIGLHRVENPSTVNPAVSLHLYSPPFSACSVFNKQTGRRTSCKRSMTALTHVQRVRILYKMILRLHRGLPVEIQPLGNQYVRDEFKRHKTCNATETHIFLNEWTDYALSLAKQLGLRGPQTAQSLGKTLNEEDFNKLRDEQLYQLYELMLAATGKYEDKFK